MIRTLLISLGLLAASGVLAGCVIVDAQAPKHIGEPPAATAAPAPAPAYDARKADQLRQDNAELRQRQAKLDSDYNQWKAAVDAREREKDRLKDQRDALKKERDRYKDALDD